MTRLAILAAAVLALLGSWGIAFRMGQVDARGECKAAEIERRLEIVQADLDRQRLAAAAAERTAEELRNAETQNEGKIDDLERELAVARAAEDAAPAPVATEPVNGKCPPPPRVRDLGATRDDLRRLRQFGPD